MMTDNVSNTIILNVCYNIIRILIMTWIPE